MSESLGWQLPFSDFIAGGPWEVDDVLWRIYYEAREAVGREFPCPGDN